MNTPRVATLLLVLWSVSAGAMAQDSGAAGGSDAAPAERRAVVERIVVDRDSGEVVQHELRGVEEEMRLAEARLEEAARRIAELSSQRLSGFGGQEFAFAFGNRPRLGINIEADSEDGPVEGVAVRGVSPGGPAFDAGLRAGDTVTAVGEQSLNAANSAEAAEKLMAYMENADPDKELELEYLRDGAVASVRIKPRAGNAQSYVFRVAPNAPHAPHAPVAPLPRIAPAPGVQEFFFWHGDGGWADMEMVPLTEGLGRYFGTDKGLLVVRAPEDDTLKLEDGDVIQSIDGREPDSIGHAVRILGSYQPGETLKIDIMRDKRKRTLDIEIPDNRQGMRWVGDGTRPAIADVPPLIVTN